MRKLLGLYWYEWVVIIVWLLVGLFCVDAKAEELPFKTNATTVLVLDAETGEPLYEKEATEIRSIASITKLMTAVVTLDAGLNLEEEIAIDPEDVVATTVRRQISGSNLPVGTKLTRAELLHLALMNSHNRAAAALARSYPGGMSAFVAAMNYKALMLGMSSTRYVDPTGLYSENVSTASDLAILVRHANDYVLIRDFSTSVLFEMTTYHKKRARKIGFGTTNRLVRKNEWDISLQKTGYIHDAGRCLVMLTKAGAKQVIIVLLNAVSNEARAADATNLKIWIETGEVPKTQVKHVGSKNSKGSKRKGRKVRRP
jgi:D-alanyl-D-alanine endopeptidase (penicillin-binding protein 7)